MDIELATALKENADFEKENKLLKSLLHCTVKSCNNCGKVNCENFQRQRVDCCGRWISFKDYTVELEKKNAELKHEVEVWKKASENNGYKAFNLEEENAELEKENKELKEKLNIRSCQNCRKYNRTCPNDGSCKNYSKWEGYKNPQLTKAKELLERFTTLDVLEGYDIVEEAEQFLKELDK